MVDEEYNLGSDYYRKPGSWIRLLRYCARPADPANGVAAAILACSPPCTSASGSREAQVDGQGPLMCMWSSSSSEKGGAVGNERHPVGGATQSALQAWLTGRGGKKNSRERGTEKRVARMYKQPGCKDGKQVCALKDSKTWEPKWDELTRQAQGLAVRVIQLGEGMKEVSQLTMVRTILREAYGTPLQQGDEDQKPPEEENFSLGAGQNIEASGVGSTLPVTLGEWD
ncbi:hypothetical protein NDU88_000289 [Pleurodeles waltl]|uniref:Uncharacterized protein n=1 Tax=Pleurodeles waltl TaxID=8319 RepID=A0AAV7TGQ2_PLEWA|nr:hypothetical protein NDU88_000289 [Pleurodeles waltl]